jgi:HEAT repeat protein
VRAAAAASFFNRELTDSQRKKLLQLAREDSSVTVRARAWEALMLSAENMEVVEAMLSALRRSDLSLEERGGLVVGLTSEADRNEVRQSILSLYEQPGGRAKALEAMWRSFHPSFRDHFAKHLDDTDIEVRRSAIWGVGYFGIRTELDRLRRFLDDEELRSDALFAYAMALPADVSRGRMKGLLARIEKDARGLSEAEEELVKTALDERLLLAGKEPVFLEQED